MSGEYEHRFEVFIRASPERVWDALTNPDLTQMYFYGTRVQSDWRPGSKIVYLGPDGSEWIVGEILAVTPQKRLVTSFSRMSERVAGRTKPSQVTWLIEPAPNGCTLTLLHTELDDISHEEVVEGWTSILAGLQRLFSS